MFKSTSFEDIELKANNILIAHNIESCPAEHMQKIMMKQGIKFAENDNFSDKADGFYMVKGDKKAIIINQNIEPEERKTFTIAHELGHHFIGHCYSGGTMECKVLERAQYNNDVKKEYDRKEQEANVFAANFLMPKEMVEPVVQQALELTHRENYGSFYLDKQSCNIRDWKICCALMKKHFKTSQTAIKWRLYYLGYVKGIS